MADGERQTAKLIQRRLPNPCATANSASRPVGRKTSAPKFNLLESLGTNGLHAGQGAPRQAFNRREEVRPRWAAAEEARRNARERGANRGKAPPRQEARRR